jgi:multiple sugar transport system ATP-binding protein
MNILSVRIVGEDQAIRVEAEGLRLRVPPERSSALKRYVGREVMLGLRPENIFDAARADFSIVDPANRVKVQVEVVERLGKELLVYFRAGNRMFVANLSQDSKARTGEFEVAFDLRKMRCFDPATQEAIT